MLTAVLVVAVVAKPQPNSLMDILLQEISQEKAERKMNALLQAILGKYKQYILT